MHVDVDELGVDPDVDHRDRVAAPLEPPLVALLERVDQRSRADGAAIDRQHHSVAVASAEAGLADQAGDQGHPDHLEHL